MARTTWLNADIGECRADKRKLLRFDLAVSRTFDFIQEPAQPAMPIDQAGSRSFRIPQR
jgi:hypothetical protein